MKNLFKKLTLLMIPFMVLGCGQVQGESVSSEDSVTTSGQKTSSQTSKNTSSNAGGKTSSKTDSSSKNNTSGPHEHKWSSTYTYNEEGHYQKCTVAGCNATTDMSAHDMETDWKDVECSSLTGADQYKYSNPKAKKCKTCGYYVFSGTNILPELRFTSNVASEIDFATKATKDDLDRPEVSGVYSLSNCPDQFKFSNTAGTMKVRGNQTAGWSKKGFRLKFNTKRGMLGLNGGQEFKKWVLFADAKDTTLSRTALGLYMARGVCKDQENIWVSDFTPVSVYLNNEYWGYYYLAEQKEVKEGRINLPEVTTTSTDIGYCFELDYYAKDEPKKADGGDPTFTCSYKPKELSYNIESNLANFGITKTYTILSDITDRTTQVPFIQKRVESLYNILYEASQNKKAKAIVNNEVTDTSDSIQKVITDNFDLATWVDGFIVNAVCCPPDVGYSSFYMSFDNSPSGAKKLRYDNPWDFDSNFGNRDGFITDPGKASSSGWGGSFDPYYMDRTSNMWLQMLSKLDFFMNMVKARWNQLREEKLFENMITMVKGIYKDYDAEFKRDHCRWPVNDAAEHNTFNELRDVYKKVSNYKNAEAETIKWCAGRINYLETKWGTGRAALPTT